MPDGLPLSVHSCAGGLVPSFSSDHAKPLLPGDAVPMALQLVAWSHRAISRCPTTIDTVPVRLQGDHHFHLSWPPALLHHVRPTLP